MSLRDRLRRLRREDSDETPEREGAPAEALGDASTTTPSTTAVSTTCGEPLDLATGRSSVGEWQARSTWFERAARHGAFELSEIEHADSADFELLTGDAALANFDLERAIYLDTETTGLSGGAGTYVYMVGLGRFEAREGRADFHCWQGFLKGPEDEAALLAECAERIRTSSGVVSFFGKSFDRHRLEDKMRLVGVAPPFDGLPHLDLYHPCRRLYREAYVDGRLKTMERELCGVEREDDLPGSFAPAAWFDYLAGRPHRLEGVFRHNRDDVLSLVALATHLGRARQESRANGEALMGDAAARALGISRSFATQSHHIEALHWLDRALERDVRPRRVWLLERAHHLRLGTRLAEALDAYRELASGVEDACSVPALLELAKLLEHHARDASAAHECCTRARTLLERLHTGPQYARLKRDLDKRLSRLAKKV